MQNRIWLASPAITLLLITCPLVRAERNGSIAQPDLIFAEVNGFVAVEAEHFWKQEKQDVRAWWLTHANSTPQISDDGDPAHSEGASGGAYLEILPDTRRTHADKLIRGTNFSPEPGKLAVLSYRVQFENAGRYYVWVRAYSTGSEDNGLHVGIDGRWPESGQRLQWCQGKNTWRWESKQRTEKQHCGEPHKIFIDVDKPGVHTIHFSMREDGFEFDKWLMTTDKEFTRPSGAGPNSRTAKGQAPKPFPTVAQSPAASKGTDGDGSVNVSGEQKLWHDVQFDLMGPFAHEKDVNPNPFTDYRMTVELTHADGEVVRIPGYFAADGDAGNTSATSGNIWRAHFAPHKVGEWKYTVEFLQGKLSAISLDQEFQASGKFHGAKGVINVTRSDKSGRDFRRRGRLAYVGKRYLQFMGTHDYFLKAGADAPETLLGYEDFDGTKAGKPKKVPLKKWRAHVSDWTPGDPTWKDGRGKGLIGAINYLSGKGCNAFSFLTYNAGGDGDNVWPFIERNAKLHYDCSKLDQWAIVFAHGTRKGMYLHFKMQETEIDDQRGHKGQVAAVPEALDGGDLGVQRKLYCRELIARFGHNLALNWNLGEENTQTTAQQNAMIEYIRALDAYDHPIVLHTFPDQQDLVYRPLLGAKSNLTGTSLQNSSLSTTHAQTAKWINESKKAGKPWVVAFDESGSAAHAQCPDLGYRGFDGRDKDGKLTHTQHDVRKLTLWGHLMAGGAGCEYYFGYKFVENDLICEDWRSRDQSWDYCRIALEFFRSNEIPYWNMECLDELVGNPTHGNSCYCLGQRGELFLVYLPNGGQVRLDLSKEVGKHSVQWFNPRSGGSLQSGSVTHVDGGKMIDLGAPPTQSDEDWVAVIKKI